MLSNIYIFVNDEEANWLVTVCPYLAESLNLFLATICDDALLLLVSFIYPILPCILVPCIVKSS